MRACCCEGFAHVQSSNRERPLCCATFAIYVVGDVLGGRNALQHGSMESVSVILHSEIDCEYGHEPREISVSVSVL